MQFPSTNVQEFNQVIKSSGCSEKVRKVSENYKEEALAQIEQRKANRNLFWQNLGEAFLQVGQMTLQAYADVNSQNSNPYSGGIVSVSSGNNLYPDLPVALDPNRVARMSVPTYSFDSNGNMMMSFPGFAQAEYEMNAALQQTISNTSSNLMATVILTIWQKHNHYRLWHIQITGCHPYRNSFGVLLCIQVLGAKQDINIVPRKENHP